MDDIKDSKPYLNRELDQRFNNFEEKLDKVLEQTTKHNSRMSKLEAWQGQVKGALYIISAVLLPIALYVIQQVVPF